MADTSISKTHAIEMRQPPSLLAACVRLTLVMLVAYPIVALIGQQVVKAPIWETAGLAAAVCWLSAVLALVVFHFLRRSGNAVAGTLGATLVRLGIPCLVGIAATVNNAKLRDEGFFGLIVGFYFIGLVADTFLTLAMARNIATEGGKSQNG